MTSIKSYPFNLNNMEWNTVYDCFCNWLGLAVNAEISYLGEPRLGIILINSNRRLDNREFKSFDMKLYDEREFVRDAFSYTSYLGDKQAKLIIKWAEENRDKWASLFNK